MRIDVFQDATCPWCRIGKRHLQLALDQWTGEPVAVRYRSFFLNEQIPPEGYPFAPYMLAKGQHQVPLEGFFDAPRRAGAAVGLRFNFERISRAPNTLLSHRVIALAPDERQADLIDAIYAAYFEHGQDIGDLDVLLDLAAADELERATLAEQLRGEAARDEVLADARWAREHGITGVPFFVFNEQYGLSGAQPPDVLLQAMDQTSRAAQERAR